MNSSKFRDLKRIQKEGSVLKVKLHFRCLHKIIKMKINLIKLKSRNIPPFEIVSLVGCNDSNLFS